MIPWTPIYRRFFHFYHPRIVNLCNLLEVSPSKWLFYRVLIYLYSIFGAGFITFGIRALDFRFSLLQTGHRGIFAITLLLWGSEAEIFTEKIWNLEERHVKISDLGSQYLQRYDMWKLYFFVGSRISSQTSDQGKIIINSVSGIGFEFCKKWTKVHGL